MPTISWLTLRRKSSGMGSCRDIPHARISRSIGVNRDPAFSPASATKSTICFMASSGDSKGRLLNQLMSVPTVTSAKRQPGNREGILEELSLSILQPMHFQAGNRLSGTLVICKPCRQSPVHPSNDTYVPAHWPSKPLPTRRLQARIGIQHRIEPDHAKCPRNGLLAPPHQEGPSPRGAGGRQGIR